MTNDVIKKQRKLFEQLYAQLNPVLVADIEYYIKKIEKAGYRCCLEVPEDVYFKLPAISKSSLCAYVEHPEKYYHNSFVEFEDKKTDAMTLGSVVHTGVLEPHKIKNFVSDKSAMLAAGGARPRLTKGYKEWVKEMTAQGKHVVKHEDFDAANIMIKKLLGDETVKEVLMNGFNEYAIFNIDAKTGLFQKGKMDICCVDYGLIMDIKTARDATRDKFQREIWDRHYHVQGAHYLRMAANIFDVSFDQMLFATIENTAPYSHTIYRLDEASLEKGLYDLDKYLSMYAESVITGEFTTFEEIEDIGLPYYAFKN